MVSLLFWLLTKHFVADFVLQTGQQAQDKGDPRKLGGYAHAATHGVFSAVILSAYGAPLYLAVLDAVVHFFIDMTKVQVSRHYQLTPDKAAYWWATGIDQYAHAMTYFGMTILAFR